MSKQSQCYVCEAYANQAHHRSYRKPDLDGRDIRRIFPICRACHETIEFRERNDEKLNPAQATAKMRQLRTRRLERTGQLPKVPEVPAIDRCVEVPINPGELQILNGEYQSTHIVALGDLVRLTNGSIGQITAIKQANYLPRFLVGGQECRVLQPPDALVGQLHAQSSLLGSETDSISGRLLERR